MEAWNILVFLCRVLNDIAGQDANQDRVEQGIDVEHDLHKRRSGRGLNLILVINIWQPKFTCIFEAKMHSNRYLDTRILPCFRIINLHNDVRD
jgi:hypothetical protein